MSLDRAFASIVAGITDIGDGGTFVNEYSQGLRPGLALRTRTLHGADHGRQIDMVVGTSGGPSYAPGATEAVEGKLMLIADEALTTVQFIKIVEEASLRGFGEAVLGVLVRATTKHQFTVASHQSVKFGPEQVFSSPLGRRSLAKWTLCNVVGMPHPELAAELALMSGNPRKRDEFNLVADALRAINAI
jgi:hypothetical protein